MKAAADGTRPVSFELGGKNAGIVFADCDFDAAIEGIVRSCFANCGQVCLGTERVYVERPIFDKFVAALKARAEKLKLGRPEDKATGIGPLISQEHRNKVLSYYDKAVEPRARRVVTGGGVPDDAGRAGKAAPGSQPTIWTGLPDDAAVGDARRSSGPCCHIAPFDTEDEVDRAGQRHRLRPRRHGLDHQPRARAPRRGAASTSGIVWVNSWFLRDLRTPFGGMQAVGHRPRGRRALARVLHRAAQRLREAVGGGTGRRLPRRGSILLPVTSTRWPMRMLVGRSGSETTPCVWSS